MHAHTDIPWEVLRSEPGPGLILFQTRYDTLRNPRNGSVMRAVVLETPDWVNVVALTPEKKILAVRQYRFGVARFTEEIPAGIMNPGETPEQAAARELQEETGYAAGRWQYLGWFEANPAFMNNVCHTWLAQDAVRVAEPQLDEGEHIAIAEYTLDEVRAAIRTGKMRNALTVLALSRAFDLREPDLPDDER